MPKTQTVFITITAAAALGAIATIGSVAQQALSGAQKLMVVRATRLPGKVHIPTGDFGNDAVGLV